MPNISFDANGNIQWIGKDHPKRPVGRPKSDNPRKTHITTTVSAEEAEAIYTASKACDMSMSMSTYIRTAVMQMTESTLSKSTTKTLPIDDQLHHQLKLHALKAGATLSAVVNQALTEYLERNGHQGVTSHKASAPKRLSADYSFGEAPQDTPAPPKNRVRLEDIPGIRL